MGFFFGQAHEAILKVFSKALIDLILLKLPSTLDQVEQSNLLRMIFLEALRENDPFSEAYKLYLLQVVVEGMDFDVYDISKILLLRLQFTNPLLE